ncbi:AAA family ATPase [Cylindrospermum sp. FACHB-282]|uniref:AAA family ATPase n=1 Tax=Cylindrospermum sp. FACHB-282 TaxID=2692794 RepID=UPI001688477D|nr:AAA family ATPase [Cylindrospermum sp. FACHB-282]MBD2387404.1 AAA family ATPase [Cylindrospermum sp. FACHB-282]
MKVEIANLGVIEKAEIDLKPLTVFIGGNGTGKTWTAYTLASILGEYGCDKYSKAYIDSKTQQRYPIIDNAIEQFLQEGNTSIDLIKFAEDNAEKYINDVANLAPSWMKNFLGTERGNFEYMQVKLNLSEAKQEAIDKLRNNFSEQRIYYFDTQNKNTLQILKESGEENVHFYITSEDKLDKIFKKLPKRIFRQLLIQVTFEILHKSFYSEIYIFPIERNAFIIFPYQVEKEINKREMIENDDKDEISKRKSIQLSMPIHNLGNILKDAYIKPLSEREEEIQFIPQISEYIKLAKLLENDILQGQLNIDESLAGKEILFQATEENVKLEMTVSSSMIKELAPLVLYLRYLAEPNELLIIDEPEMNLHPAAQVEITEFLAMLVQAGLKVLITTHSPYIVDHLSNLMKAAKYEDKDSIKDRFYLERTEAFIPQEKVSVYLFEDSTAKNILHENGRIDWGTFGNVSDDISHIFP